MLWIFMPYSYICLTSVFDLLNAGNKYRNKTEIHFNYWKINFTFLDIIKVFSGIHNLTKALFTWWIFINISPFFQQFLGKFHNCFFMGSFQTWHSFLIFLLILFKHRCFPKSQSCYHPACEPRTNNEAIQKESGIWTPECVKYFHLCNKQVTTTWWCIYCFVLFFNDKWWSILWEFWHFYREICRVNISFVCSMIVSIFLGKLLLRNIP